MADKPKISVDVIFNSRDARDFANNFGNLLSKTAKKWRDDVKEMTGEGAAAGLKIALASGKGGAAIKEFVKTNIADVYSKFMKELRAGNFEEAEKLERILDGRVKRFQKEADAIAEAFKHMQDRQARTFDEHADAFGDKVQKLQRGLFGGLGGFTDLARSGGGAVQRFGREQQAKGLRAREMAMSEGKDAKGAERMAQFGKVIANIGKAAVAFAAVAGAVLLLVKLFADLESKMKDANKAMIDSAGAADFGFGHVDFVTGKLTKQLDKMRQSTQDLNDNFLKFRVTAEQQQKILSQFNAAGYTFKRMNEEIAKGEKFMQNFSDVTSLAVTYSRNLGTDVGEVADKMGAFAFDTGAGLRDIAEQFSVIQREAMVAGFVTKRFYSAVVEATTGMSFYGVRIEETSKLLKTFDSLLGEAAGTDAFKKLVGQYQDKSAQDRLRDFLVKDQEFVTERFQKSFETRMAQLTRQYGDEIAKSGTSIDKLLAESTSEVDLRAKLGALGIRGQQATDFANLRGLQQAASGNRAAQLAHAGAAGPSFDIAMAIKTALPVQQFGENIGEALGRAVEENNSAVIIALQELESKTGKSFDEVVALSNAAEAQLQELRKIRDTGGQVPDELKKFGFFIDEQSKEIRRGIVDSNGEILTDNAVELNDLFDVLLSQPTEGEKQLEEQLTKDQEIATEISKNITGLNEIMEQSVTAILGDIYSVTSEILAFMKFDSGKTRDFMNSQNEKKAAEAEAKSAQAQEDLADAQEKLRLAESRKELGAIDAAKKQVETAEHNLQAAQQTQMKLGKLARASTGISEEALLEGRGLTTAQSASPVFASTGHAKAAEQRIQEIVADQIKTWGESFFAPTFEDSLGFSVERFGAKIMEDPELVKQLGGERNVTQALQAADAAVAATREDTMTGFLTEKEISTTTASAFQQAIVQGLVEQEGAQLEKTDNLFQKLIEVAEQQLKATRETRDVGTAEYLQEAQKAHDLIIPADGGRPIMTDERDTLMAMRPGGPLSRSGRGGGGSVTVNVYGGNRKDVYDTVMKVLKQTGNA